MAYRAAGFRDVKLGSCRGMIADRCAGPAAMEKLRRLGNSIAERAVSRRRRNAHFCIELPVGEVTLRVWVKSFGSQFLLKDWVDAFRGSKARRAFHSALCLARAGVGTPVPVGYLERWDGWRLKESYYLSEFEPGLVSFKDALIGHFIEDPCCERIMKLLETVAWAVADMHGAGFFHGDLGNQNILLRRRNDGSWGEVLFLDLNRGKAVGRLSLRLRARDISRIYLPSDLLRVFKEMYFRGVRPPVRFQRWERWFRRVYAFHTLTRAIRHPSRLFERAERGGPDYPPEKEMWIWDERSAQPINVMRPRDRFRHLPLVRTGALLARCALSAPAIWRESARILEGCFAPGLKMTARVGIALDPRLEILDRQIELIRSWGTVPVLIRIMHHEGESRWTECIDCVRKLKLLGHPVSVALVQDRAAVRDPERWRSFVCRVTEAIADSVEWIEAGHAINRVKWGIWDYDEYARLIEPFAEAARKCPQVSFMGPAGIDYEYLFVMAALRRLPDGFRFRALSHHLYVDRRGAPESRQGPSSLLEKCAQARAIARLSGVCDDRFIVSETGWPLLGTGVYSPVTSPYESPGPRRNDPSVSEEVYADYMLRYLAIALASGLAEKVFWWRLTARGFGLVDDTDAANWRPRPAFHAMGFFLKLLGSSVFEGRDRDLELDGAMRGYDRDRVLCLRFRTPDGSLWAMCWTAAGEISARMRGVREAVDVFGNVLHQPEDGRVRLTGRPIYLKLDGRD